KDAISRAEQKSSRQILGILDSLEESEKIKIYNNKGKKLFEYFRRYYGDQATTAYDCIGKHFSDIAKEQFRNQTLQKERMNSGWRYQYIAKDCAEKSRRFLTVSDIGTAEADFNATLSIVDDRKGVLNIYVSIKNRTNTMGGQDWPKAIYALEDVARTDKNRTGPYLCVFGIVMERGQRLIKANKKNKSPYSVNTEVWLSDFFWPFFSNYSYVEIVRAVLEILLEEERQKQPISKAAREAIIPKELIESFGEHCKRAGLLDEEGKFNDPLKLIDFFCQNTGDVKI